MITESEYKNLKEKYEYYHSEREKIFPGKCSFSKEDQSKLPVSPTNDEISAIEMYEFVNDPPTRYFCYVSPDKNKYPNLKNTFIGQSCKITTWTGDILGYGKLGTKYRSNKGMKGNRLE